MIQTGSSGSYFIRACLDMDGNVASASSPPDSFSDAIKSKRIKTVAVFKPNDEEPYGNLNPKRVFLRRYLWWAMGRPCLIPSFSYLSEVGASLLDERLRLSIVPSTRLVELSSSVFSYLPKARKRGTFHEKIGSYQNFLHGYVNASTFLRAHPWPSRPRNLLEQDLVAENHAHGRAKARARKGEGAKKKSRNARGCLPILQKPNCCSSTSTEEEDQFGPPERQGSIIQTTKNQIGFHWTKDLMQDFRLELEKLVCFDYLIRNTDRGLDNFMVKVDREEPTEERPSGWRLSLAAIDNSLAFPWKHPAGIRSYPWGWLYLPTDLIGGNFSTSTKQAFVSYLSNPSWWNETERELKKLFLKDDHFDEKKFQGQMEVLRGQGWNLLESLRSEEEGPLELCARQKQMVKQKHSLLDERELPTMTGSRLPLTSAARLINRKLRLANDLTNGTRPSVPSIPIAVKASESVAFANKDEIQPRSLPETINEEQVSHRWNQASVIDDVSKKDNQVRIEPVRGRSSNNIREDEAIGKAYRGKSLGIEVLTEIDKSASKTKRPNLRKALTGNSSRNVRSKNSRNRRLEVQSEASEREEYLEDSIASLPGTSAVSFLKTNRRRNGSMGDMWSISSMLERSDSHEIAVEEDVKRYKVIIEVSDGQSFYGFKTNHFVQLFST